MQDITFRKVLDFPTTDATLTGPSTHSISVAYPAQFTSSLSAITGYSVEIDTSPIRTFEVVGKDALLNIPVDYLEVGDVVTITAYPTDGTDKPYIPLTKTFTITAGAVIVAVWLR